MSEPSPQPAIVVTEEARRSLVDFLSRSGPAQYIRVHVGYG